VKQKPGSEDAADLVVEPQAEGAADSFTQELERSLSETEQQALLIAGARGGDQAASWAKARAVVKQFRPVPWFIWRLSNYVFGKAGQIREIQEGLVLGLRKLLFATASDPFLGVGRKVNNLREALSVLPADLIAAVAVIHAVCRRLATYQFERIWRPILDDAILRAQLGYFVGARKKEFGVGRGMLAGFAGRSGLAILIASGELGQARKALEMLATGADISDVGYLVYGCDPLQVSAMALSASGCGKDAAHGTISYAALRGAVQIQDEHQLCWLAAFSVVELVRMGREGEIESRFWTALGFDMAADYNKLIEEAVPMIKRGHTLMWLV